MASETSSVFENRRGEMVALKNRLLFCRESQKKHLLNHPRVGPERKLFLARRELEERKIWSMVEVLMVVGVLAIVLWGICMREMSLINLEGFFLRSRLNQNRHPIHLASRRDLISPCPFQRLLRLLEISGTPTKGIMYIK